MKTLPYRDLMKLKRWNTPTIYNGWEQITRHDRTKGWFNMEETRDFMPQMGPMVGYAVTVVCEPSNPKHKEQKNAAAEYRKYVASIPFPKIVVVQDLDKPNHVGSFWGEVGANIHRALGCVGTITDGCIRDLDEMNNSGFKAIASRMCVGHAYSTPVSWGEEVEVFGCKIKPGSLVHADKHGFMVIPEEDMDGLLEAASFMDANECNTVIEAARTSGGKGYEKVLAEFNDAAKRFQEAAKVKYGKKGEW
ncbi:MAG: RraA family protein [Bacteroidota bacterium]